jgi:putative Mg2+ transporter-C (MgtC) family protein
MFDELQTIDVYKCLASLGAGLLLGLERELKDKAAGLKTITVICLGATLFSILSLRFDPDRATALAAYIVSGVGFLGAGVIFKDGVNVSGLTTASIIWLAAAVGTSIGFGEFYLGAIFLAGSFVVVWITPLVNKLISSKWQSKDLKLCIHKDDYAKHQEIIQVIKQHTLKVKLLKISLTADNTIELVLDIVLEKTATRKLSELLLSDPRIKSFEL